MYLIENIDEIKSFDIIDLHFAQRAKSSVATLNPYLYHFSLRKP